MSVRQLLSIPDGEKKKKETSASKARDRGGHYHDPLGYQHPSAPLPAQLNLGSGSASGPGYA